MLKLAANSARKWHVLMEHWNLNLQHEITWLSRQISSKKEWNQWRLGKHGERNLTFCSRLLAVSSVWETFGDFLTCAIETVEVSSIGTFSFAYSNSIPKGWRDHQLAMRSRRDTIFRSALSAQAISDKIFRRFPDTVLYILNFGRCTVILPRNWTWAVHFWGWNYSLGAYCADNIR